ncbi:MAG TPA: NADH-quinone oxidoreductase subunit C [Sphingomonas sp.]|jgi:NADH-quinone oxidoreductase subunit C|nr:NADH-quinone oxidoreductase subunit C [Sphingomonas sp.]
MTVAPLVKPHDGLIDAVRAAHGAGVVDAWHKVDETTITVTREALVPVLTWLRDAQAYQQLMEIAGADYPERPERFDLNYHLLSVTRNTRVRVKVTTDEATPVPTVTGLWPVANWLEREVFDLYGVLFDGHPDLRRILTDYGFTGHPLRKDFPLTGYQEVWYSEEAKRVVYEPVKLAQDLRNWDFLSPWEGAEYVLPGDEKAALPEAKGAPTPLSADEIKKADAAQTSAKTPVAEPKTTETKGQSGAGEPTDTAAKKRVRKTKPKDETNG